ncbi:hypothetical protein [Superficieibacter sp.]|uniref:hypothetical protein n=1 Tax=Superficieibacter sp. TaxID=2303322 RepID=UPI0028AF1540|nr:hypothetical protein [Superficieibacter sp.]
MNLPQIIQRALFIIHRACPPDVINTTSSFLIPARGNLAAIARHKKKNWKRLLLRYNITITGGVPMFLLLEEAHAGAVFKLDATRISRTWIPEEM